MNCLTDGRPTNSSRRKYCSRECYYAARRQGLRNMATCGRCGLQFSAKPSAKRKFCGTECYRLRMIRMGKYEPCHRCGYDIAPTLVEWDGAKLCPNCWAFQYWELSGRPAGLGTLIVTLEDAFATA